MKAVQQEKTNGDEFEAYIMSIFNKYFIKALFSYVTIESKFYRYPVLLENHYQACEERNE